MGISLRGYARHRGVTLKAVQKAVARKRIKLESDGTVDAARADRDWTANSDLAGVLGVLARPPEDRRSDVSEDCFRLLA
jgi:hypothetical protein